MASYAIDYGDDEYQYSPKWMQENYKANAARKPASNPDLVNAQYNIDLSEEPYYNAPEKRGMVVNALADKINKMEEQAKMEEQMISSLNHPSIQSAYKVGSGLQAAKEGVGNAVEFGKDIATEFGPEVGELGLDFVTPSMVEDQKMGRGFDPGSFANDVLEMTPAYPFAAGIRAFTEAADEGKSYEEAKKEGLTEAGIGLGLTALLAGVPYLAKTRKWIPRAKAAYGRLSDKISNKLSDTSKWGY